MHRTLHSEAWLVFNMKMSCNYKMLCDCEVSKNITRRPGHQSDSNGRNADGIQPLCLSLGHSQADKFCQTTNTNTSGSKFYTNYVQSSFKRVSSLSPHERQGLNLGLNYIVLNIGSSDQTITANRASVKSKAKYIQNRV